MAVCILVLWLIDSQLWLCVPYLYPDLYLCTHSLVFKYSSCVLWSLRLNITFTTYSPVHLTSHNFILHLHIHLGLWSFPILSSLRSNSDLVPSYLYLLWIHFGLCFQLTFKLTPVAGLANVWQTVINLPARLNPLYTPLASLNSSQSYTLQLGVMFVTVMGDPIEVMWRIVPKAMDNREVI